MRRLGKRIVFGLEGDLFLVLHLMIAGRLHWLDARREAARRGSALAAFDFADGTLLFTEAGTKKRASLHLVARRGRARAVRSRAGSRSSTRRSPTFAARLARENHTLKRALTDPRLFSGIGNAYSDEILHRARLSPVKLTAQARRRRDRAAVRARRATCSPSGPSACAREAGDGFPEKVTAFRPEMAVHGRYGQPCPVCGAPVQRIVYAENESNYCARCQTGGKLLADRALSRLLHKSWPRSIDELM